MQLEEQCVEFVQLTLDCCYLERASDGIGVMRQMELHSPVELQAYADLILVRNGGDDSACAHSGAQPVASNAHVAALLAAWHGDFGLQGALVFPGVSGALRSSVLDAAF